MQVQTPPTVLPALHALAEVRKEIKRRIGKEGGHLNRMFLAQLDTIEATLRQIEPLASMIQTINQQTQVTLSAVRSLERMALPEHHDPDPADVDDGNSETKGS